MSLKKEKSSISNNLNYGISVHSHKKVQKHHNLVIQSGEDVGVAGVGDGEDGDAEVLTASSAQFDVVA